MTDFTPSAEDIKSFMAAARHLNFSRAAAEMRQSPARFGQRIRRLEERLGVVLFLRSTRHVELSDAGHRFLPHAKRSLLAARQGVRAAMLPETRRELTLGTRHEFGLASLCPILKDLEGDGLLLHLHVASGPELIRRLHQSRVHCIVTSARIADPALIALDLVEEHYEFVASPELLSRSPCHTWDDVRKHVLLDTNDALPLFRYLRDIRGSLEAQHFKSLRKLGAIAHVRDFLLRGEGVAVLPRQLLEHDLRLGTLTRIFPKVELQPDRFRLVFRAGDPMRHTYEHLHERLTEHLRLA